MNDPEENKESAALGKQVTSSLYQTEAASRGARMLGYTSVEQLNSLVAEIRKEMLKGTEADFIKTAANATPEMAERLAELPAHTAVDQISDEQIVAALIGDGGIKTKVQTDSSGVQITRDEPSDDNIFDEPFDFQGQKIKTSVNKDGTLNKESNGGPVEKRVIKTAIIDNQKKNGQQTNGRNMSIDDRNNGSSHGTVIGNTKDNGEFTRSGRPTGEGSERVIATGVNFDRNALQTVSGGVQNVGQVRTGVDTSKQVGVVTAGGIVVNGVSQDGKTVQTGTKVKTINPNYVTADNQVIETGIPDGLTDGTVDDGVGWNSGDTAMVAVAAGGLATMNNSIAVNGANFNGAGGTGTGFAGTGTAGAGVGNAAGSAMGKATKSTFEKVSKGIGKTTKVLKTANKIGGKAVKASKSLNVFDAQGKVNAIDATSNQIKTLAKGAGKIASKPVKKVAKKAVKKVMRKPMQKLSQILIKFLASITKAVISFLVAYLPALIIFLVLVVVLVVCLCVFGGNLSDDQMADYANYIKETNTSFQSETLKYYNQNYIVDGTYNGIADINWVAALSVLQELQPELDGSEAEFALLDKLRSDGVMYTISEEETEEYVLQEEIYTSSGKLIQEEETTTTKYVVRIGTIDDYTDWVQNNLDYIFEFFDEEEIGYDPDNFAVDDLINDIETLYNSDPDVFSTLIDEAGVSLTASSIEAGTVFDTGSTSGIFKYPTNCRELSAGFPTYPSGGDHTGVDFPVAVGTPVCACADGVVIVAKKLTTSYGRYIVIEHDGINNGQTLYTLYAHNSQLLVKVGDTVEQGQIIAYSGQSGNVTGAHLHLSVLDSWNPQHYLQPMDFF